MEKINSIFEKKINEIIENYKIELIYNLDNKERVNLRTKFIFDIIYNLLKYKKKLADIKVNDIGLDILSEIDKILSDNLKLTSIIEKVLFIKYFINDKDMVDENGLTNLGKEFLLSYKEKINERYQKYNNLPHQNLEFYLNQLEKSLNYYGDKFYLIVDFLKNGERKE